MGIYKGPFWSFVSCHWLLKKPIHWPCWKWLAFGIAKVSRCRCDICAQISLGRKACRFCRLGVLIEKKRLPLWADLHSFYFNALSFCSHISTATIQWCRQRSGAMPFTIKVLFLFFRGSLCLFIHISEESCLRVIKMYWKFHSTPRLTMAETCDLWMAETDKGISFE